MKRWLALSLCLFPLLAHAQSYTISGFVQDAESGEKLIGANLFDMRSQLGTSTNRYGFFSLTLPADSVTLRVSYLGYQTRFFNVDLQDDLEFNIELPLASTDLETVEVTAEREVLTQSSQMSVVELPLEQVKTMPAFLGETDILKVLQLLPGVQSGSEGSSGLYVRGGGPDQNLILLDDAPVYNASHLFGFFSVFNADALQNVELVKGGFPARYGGRLSSVLDIKMKEGNMKTFTTEGAIGLIASRLTVQGPIIKDKMSFILSGRRTYADILAQPFIRAQQEGRENIRVGYFFYDFNGKINYAFTPQNRLYLSLYTGRDQFYDELEDTYTTNNVRYNEKYDNDLYWGNITSTLRWNYVFNNKLFSNTTLTYSRYRFNIQSAYESTETNAQDVIRQQFAQSYFSGIEDLGAKIDFDFLPAPQHYIRFGASATRHIFRPGVARFREEVTNTTPIDTTLTPNRARFVGTEFYAYAEDDFLFSDRLKANVGLHFSGLVTDDVFYPSLQPRVSLRYLVREDWSVKAAFSTMQQYLHLLTNSGINLPTDLWVPATARVEPQKSWQVAFGTAHTFDNGAYELSIEGYYKDMQNLIEYKPGATFFNLNDDWQDKIETGRGWSYGAEVFLQKKTGRTTGWIGYTLSWTNRRFAGLNDGATFPYRYDRRHDISVVANHRLSDRIELSGAWVYGTGNAVTLPLARFNHIERDPSGFSYPRELLEYGPRNGFRMGSYHRLDVAVNFHKRRRSFLLGEGERTWTLGLYNGYNRKNPFYLYASHDNNGNPVFKQVSIFPVLPAISYRFKY